VHTCFSDPRSNYDIRTGWCCHSPMDNFKRAEL